MIRVGFSLLRQRVSQAGQRPGTRQRRRRVFNTGIAQSALAALALLALAVPGVARGATISSSGPLTEITISEQLNCDVRHLGDTDPEFFGATACGTFLAVGGTLFGPAVIPAGGPATPRTAFSPVSQSAVLGSGTPPDPYRIVTVADLGTTNLRITETDSYVVGEEAYRTDVEIANSGAADQNFLLSRAGDCFLQNSDLGFGDVESATGAVACRAGVDDGSGTIVPGTRIEQWFPLSAGSSYMEAGYSDVWARIGSQQPFPNTCECSVYIDNGAGLSWAGTVAAGGTVTFSHLTVFSPLGRVPLSTTKIADQATAQPGAADSYTITVVNPNTSSVTLDSITDTLPVGFTYTPGSTTGATSADPAVSGQTLAWTGPFAVPAGGSISLHFGVMVSSTSGDYLNEATAAATGFTVAPTGPTAQITVTAGGGSDLAMTKGDAPDPVAVGGSLTYTLTVTNNGPDPSTDSTVTDALPPGVTFVSATPTQGACSEAAGTVTCMLGPLALGASATIQIVVTVDATALSPLSDTATVTGVDTDPVAANNSATAETMISVPSELDHFKCYKTKQVGTKFDPRQVVLTDQFNTERVNVVRPQVFCAPVDKDGSGINDPAAHLACYKIRDVRGDEFPKFMKERVEVTEQFGTRTLLLKKIRSLCLPSSKAPVGEVPGSPPTGLDHFKCYKTKQVGTKFDPRQVVLTDQFNTERVNVVRPQVFCAPVDKDGSGINDPAAHLACYKIRDVRGDEFPKFERQRLEAADQFGTHTLLLKKTRTLCLPSSKTVH
jgi:uncharacterized repeat protein (TIGR01451 family)